MSDMPAPSPAPSFEAAPPPKAPAAEFGLQAANATESKNFQLQPEQQTRENNMVRSVGQWLGEKFSKPTDKPRETIQQLSDYDLAADRAPIVKHLKLNGFSDDDIAAHLSKMKMGEGGVSNVVLEQQKERKMQTEAAGISQKMQAGMETAAVTQAERLKLQQEKMSPAVHAQQDERRTFNQQVEGAVTQAKIEQNKPADGSAPKIETTPVQSLNDLEVVSSATAAPKTENSSDATQPIVVEGPAEIQNPTNYAQMEGPTAIPDDTQASETTTSTSENKTQKPVAETSENTSTEKAQKRSERIQQYKKEAMGDRPPRPERGTMKASEFWKAQKQWVEQESKALNQVENEANLAADMQEWEDDHQMPAKDTSAYQQWVKDYGTFLSQQENNYGLQSEPEQLKAQETETDVSASLESAVKLAVANKGPEAAILAQNLGTQLEQVNNPNATAEQKKAANAELKKTKKELDKKGNGLGTALLGIYTAINALKHAMSTAA